MGRRNDHSREEIRDMALDASMHLLEQGGLQGLSARKIAAEIGYTVGTLYLVFENLDDLILQLNLRTLKALQKHLQQAASPQSKPELQLKAIAYAYIDFAMRQEAVWRMIYEHALPEQSEALEEYQQLSSSLLRFIEEILSQAIAVPDEQLADHARALWGGVHGICVLTLANKIEQGSRQSLYAITDILIERFIQESINES